MAEESWVDLSVHRHVRGMMGDHCFVLGFFQRRYCCAIRGLMLGLLGFQHDKMSSVETRLLDKGRLLKNVQLSEEIFKMGTADNVSIAHYCTL